MIRWPNIVEYDRFDRVFAQTDVKLVLGTLAAAAYTSIAPTRAG